jgi:hypothetical protein
MTAIKDALKKAGLDTARAELTLFASDALRMHGGPEKAHAFFWRMLKKRLDLCEVIASDFLFDFAAKSGEAGAAAGQLIADTHGSHADGGTASIRKATVKVAAYDVGTYKRRPPSAKEAAREAAMAGAAAMADVYSSRLIDGRPIGDLSWKELGLLVGENAMRAASFILLGTEAAENAIILHKIANWASVDNQEARVRDVIKAEQLKTFIAEAQREAPAVLARLQNHVSNTLKSRTAIEDATHHVEEAAQGI